MQTIQAGQVTLSELKQKFGLTLVEDPNFFLEWSAASSDVTELEKYWLDRVQSNFTALFENPPVLENSVKMVVLSPLLDLAGFYEPPYRIESETSVEIQIKDEEEIIRGRIDVLVLNARLWLVVIESKRAEFAIQTAIPQALSYMLGNPEADLPSYGLVTNGHTFIFLKLMRRSTLEYANSCLFSLINPGNDLYAVLGILKQIGAAIAS